MAYSTAAKPNFSSDENKNPDAQSLFKVCLPTLAQSLLRGNKIFMDHKLGHVFSTPS